MSPAGRQLRLLDPQLFWRKLVMLLLFFGLFVPLYQSKNELALYSYVIFLIALHVAVLGIFVWRVRWRVLAEDRRGFFVRVLALVIFVVLLALLRFDVPTWQFYLVVAASFAIHVAILASLTVVWRAPAPVADSFK